MAEGPRPKTPDIYPSDRRHLNGARVSQESSYVELTEQDSTDGPDATDAPLTPDKDVLGFDVYANSLADMLLDSTTKIPLTVGVYGDWGSGRTSMLQLIRHRLEDAVAEQGNAPVVRYIWKVCRCINIPAIPLLWGVSISFFVLFIIACIASGIALYHSVEYIGEPVNSVNVSSNSTLTASVTRYSVDSILDLYRWVPLAVLACFIILSFLVSLVFCGLAKRINFRTTSFKFDTIRRFAILVFFLPKRLEPVVAPEAQTEFIFVDFSAWEYIGCKELWAGIITALCNSVESHFGSLLTRYYRLLDRDLYKERDVSSKEAKAEDLTYIRTPYGGGWYYQLTHSTKYHLQRRRESNERVPAQQSPPETRLPSHGPYVTGSVTYRDTMDGSATVQVGEDQYSSRDRDSDLMLSASGAPDTRDDTEAESPGDGDHTKRGCLSVHLEPRILCCFPKLATLFIFIYLLLFFVVLLIMYGVHFGVIKSPSKEILISLLLSSTGLFAGFVRYIYPFLKILYHSITYPIGQLRNMMKSESFEEELGYMYRVKGEIQKLNRMIAYLSWLRQKNIKIVLFIDDLDRCSDQNLAKMLEAIRIMLSDKENNFFISIIAIRKQSIAAALDSGCFGITGVPSHEYIKSVINLPFSLPIRKDEDVANIIQQQLKELNPEGAPPLVPAYRTRHRTESRTSPGKYRPHWHIVLETLSNIAEFLNRNPRDLKRLINICNLATRLAIQVDKTVELKSLVCLLVLFEQWPYRSCLLLYLEQQPMSTMIHATMPLEQLYNRHQGKLYIPEHADALIRHDADLNVELFLNRCSLTMRHLKKNIQYLINCDKCLVRTLREAINKNTHKPFIPQQVKTLPGSSQTTV